MSKENGQTENFNEEVAVNEIETVELVDGEVEAKKAKLIATAKKVGKIAGIIGVGVLGYIIGSKVNSKMECNESEIIDSIENIVTTQN